MDAPRPRSEPAGKTIARYPLHDPTESPSQPEHRENSVERLFKTKAFADTVAQIRPIPTTVEAVRQQVINQLTDDERATLHELPPMCTSELPGLDLSDVVPARDRLPDELVKQASAGEPLNVSHARDNAPAAARVASVHNPHSPDMMKADLQQYRIARAVAGKDPDEDPHLEIYSRSAFPSARDCAGCHKQLYEEWAGSSHAYASISPMFHKFEDKINMLSQGTLGYFCLRCHAPVATTMGLRRDQPIWDGPEVFREGVTCVACHRVKIPYTKTNGERRIEPGGLNDPVYGASDGNGGAIAHKYKDFFKVTSDPNDKKQGQLMHRRAIQFDELAESTFCMSCHQVAVQPGIKLEVVWDQYRASPAYREGVSCQDCHMGIVPGVDGGYSIGPSAVVNDKVVNAERKHSNHTFYGPGYSIAHPGIFPHNLKNTRWTVNDWLQFDWRGGWGTEEFEKAIADNQFYTTFPEVWSDADDRADAREIVDENLKKLEYKKDLRRQVLENGSKLDGPFFFEKPTLGEPLKFRYCLTNTNPGHNMPSGSLGAQPQLWMNVVLIGPSGQRIWETGYVDSNGDLADNHSLDVLARKIPFDTQLFNLQTKFLTTNVKGTDREMYLPINIDIDQLPFLRPPAQPVSVLNHPPFIRMEGHSLPALGSRNAKFVVPSRLMREPGVYRMSVRMRSRAEPIYFMRFCDATPEMERMMNEWIADFHVQTVTFEVH
jgi:nitrate reductase cytochrome c-type subunit